MIACSNNQNMLVGKWKLVNTSSPQRMNKSLEKGLIWEFYEDNTYTSSSFEGVNSQGGWRAEGSILYMTDAGIADKDNTVGEMEMIKLTALCLISVWLYLLPIRIEESLEMKFMWKRV